MNLLYVMLFQLGIFLIGCSDDKEISDRRDIERGHLLSGTHKYLNNLKEDFDLEYRSAQGASSSRDIIHKYGKKLEDFLFDSLNIKLDSIRVVIDAVVVRRNGYFTRFHSNNILFESDVTFSEENKANYTKLLLLKKGQKIMINFQYMGNCQLNDPADKKHKCIFLHADLEPLSPKTKLDSSAIRMRGHWSQFRQYS